MYVSLVVAIYAGLSIQNTLQQKQKKSISAIYWIKKAALSLLCVKKERTFENRSYGNVALRGGPPTIYSNAQPYNNNNSATCDVITTSLTYGGDK